MAQKPTKEQTMTLANGANARQQIIRATREAARADNIPVNADGLAFLIEPRAMFVNAPITGIEKLDLDALLNGQPVLDDRPIMYWQLSGPEFDGDNRIVRAGHYIVVADATHEAVSLRALDGTAIANGDLTIKVEPAPKSASMALLGVSVSGGIDSFKITKKGIKVCGHVTIEVGPTSTVKVKGCISTS
jgi:hypothetical protein